MTRHRAVFPLYPPYFSRRFRNRSEYARISQSARFSFVCQAPAPDRSSERVFYFVCRADRDLARGLRRVKEKQMARPRRKYAGDGVYFRSVLRVRIFVAVRYLFQIRLVSFNA